MLKKLTALLLSLLFCLSLLPSRAYAMDAPKNESPIKVEGKENLSSFSDADAGIAPCRVSYRDPDGGGGPGIFVDYGPNRDGAGREYGPTWP